MAETREYANRWTDWDPGSERKTRVRYETTGYGDEGRRAAERIAADTRRWQPRHGLPADAVVVSRPIGEWEPVEDAPEVPYAE